MDKIREVSIRRCKNRPVKAIAKELGMSRDDVEKVISKLIRETDPFIEEKVKGRRKVNLFTDITPLIEGSDFTKAYAEALLKNEAVLDYIAVKSGDHHDRFMDCIRYHIHLLLEG
ncbi:hypothetical protein [Sulfuracidifex tepidarius]|uniref:Uncharacterized protein n=1 Tax=Sulfuracidifex tepidarius TaxID=1294262 RepID=A0A510E1G6_9CREN|nr:hypothetical protein [Sulfuracidifex tepidarius]BBG23543.1 hypothetical protein IC006_0827 [Sulfuracidifex tepidarius]BBG26297.1 hypothetical protein IC007_0802 [Sulfuracidifex tepidarius]